MTAQISILKEEWVVLRSFKEFTIFHKFLKTRQVNTSEYSVGTAAKLTGLATTALTLGSLSQHTAKRKTLVPSLNKAVQAGALSATKKYIEKRKDILNHYLSHLLSRGIFLRRCPELLRFIGAYEPTFGLRSKAGARSNDRLHRQTWTLRN